MYLLILVDSEAASMYEISENDAQTSITVSATFGAFDAREVTIIGTDVVPEFSAGLLPLLLIVSLISTLLRKKWLVKREK